MNRTDRPYALVEELRAVAPRSRSASDLARRFEVSVRTIERDLSTLKQAGVPIYATPGRRGGYTVDAARTLPPLNFTPAEATAVAVALARPGATPLAQAARTALRKLLAAMADAAAAQALARRVHVLTPPAAGMQPLGIDPLQPRGVPAVEHGEALVVKVGRDVGGFVDLTGHEGGEGIDGQQHARPGVVQASRGRRVEQGGRTAVTTRSPIASEPPESSHRMRSGGSSTSPGFMTTSLSRQPNDIDQNTTVLKHG